MGDIANGCPLADPAVDMRAVDGETRRRVAEMCTVLEGGSATPPGGRRAGEVRADIDAARFAGSTLMSGRAYAAPRRTHPAGCASWILWPYLNT